ncbi:ester cyclase [Paraburkholderia sp. 2C]
MHCHSRSGFEASMARSRGMKRAIDFQAFDLCRVKDGQIVENWHLQDNLTLLKQLGVIRQ